MMFDQRAAVVAIDACERMRSALLGFADSHAHAAGLARRDWSGPHRAGFECAFADIQDDLTRQATALTELANRIEDAAAAAAVAARDAGPR